MDLFQNLSEQTIALLRIGFLYGPFSGSILYFALRYFFKGTILFKVGLATGLLAILLGITAALVEIIGVVHLLWTVPLDVAVLIFVFRFYKKNVQTPLIEINQFFGHLSQGKIRNTQRIEFDRNDEFGAISNSAESLMSGFSNMSNFAAEIEQGNLNAKYEKMSEDDELGTSLIEMQQSLIQAQEAENTRKKEDEKLFWANEGYAKFGEILRQNNENNNEFYYSIISNLVKYVGANQGGMFLINDEDENDKHIELVAMYAYDRRKYTNQRIEMGETLVGQCVLEGESIYMTEIPQSYIRITSGLGDANPGSLFIVPLRFNEKVYGVIELAAFSEFEPFKQNFIEKLGESIASTISTYKINLRTVKLLQDSKTQGEELAAQEEEIRQNMEELQTTQEESARREAEMSNTLKALNQTTMIAELDLNGHITEMNERYAACLSVASSSTLTRPWVNFIIENEDDNFAEVLNTVKEGNTYERTVRSSNGTSILERYVLVHDAEGFPLKIINTGIQLN